MNLKLHLPQCLAFSQLFSCLLWLVSCVYLNHTGQGPSLTHIYMHRGGLSFRHFHILTLKICRAGSRQTLGPWHVSHGPFTNTHTHRCTEVWERGDTCILILNTRYMQTVAMLSDQLRTSNNWLPFLNYLYKT